MKKTTVLIFKSGLFLSHQANLPAFGRWMLSLLGHYYFYSFFPHSNHYIRSTLFSVATRFLFATEKIPAVAKTVAIIVPYFFNLSCAFSI